MRSPEAPLIVFSKFFSPKYFNLHSRVSTCRLSDGERSENQLSGAALSVVRKAGKTEWKACTRVNRKLWEAEELKLKLSNLWIIYLHLGSIFPYFFQYSEFFKFVRFSDFFNFWLFVPFIECFDFVGFLTLFQFCPFWSIFWIFWPFSILSDFLKFWLFSIQFIGIYIRIQNSVQKEN